MKNKSNQIFQDEFKEFQIEYFPAYINGEAVFVMPIKDSIQDSICHYNKGYVQKRSYYKKINIGLNSI